MDLHLQGKAAIITGGASGLGRATAGSMRAEGVNLLLADLNEGVSGLEQTTHLR